MKIRPSFRMGFFTIFIGLFFLIGFGLLGYGLWSAWQSSRVSDWPTAPGTLTHVDLKKKTDNESTMYEVVVEYSYDVGGKSYTGSRLAYGYTSSNAREMHTSIYDKLVRGKTVDVRYDPADPATSALSFGIHRSIQLSLIFAVVWLVFTFGFLLIWKLALAEDSVLLQNMTVR
jgi:hypothetical protein